ncbi:hypothetical protein [Microbacterium sp. A1-JK]|uniref:hypothetical protein n=1 Tax=Microbacterium sp. A1-JK TaxID=3177516 RepID=UPI00388A2500
MIIDYFPASVAADANANLARNAEANVYALADTSFSTPLSITDLQGVPMAKLTSSDVGIFPPFRVVNGTQQIVVVSGDLKTPMTSLSVAAAAAEAAASLAATSASAADSAATTAATARTDAVAAAAAAAAVGNTNDTIIEGRIKDPASKTALALGDKFGAVGTSLAEGNVTLVTVPRVITLTGATQSRIVTLPAGVYDARVFNDTDYEHTLIRTGSANGTPIAPGAAVEIVSA